jgi:hypothetical protein
MRLSYDNLTVLSLLIVQWRQQASWHVCGAMHTYFPNTICYLFSIRLLNYSQEPFKSFRNKLMHKIILNLTSTLQKTQRVFIRNITRSIIFKVKLAVCCNNYIKYKRLQWHKFRTIYVKLTAH